MPSNWKEWEGGEPGGGLEGMGRWVGLQGTPTAIISLAFPPLAVMKGNHSTLIWCYVSAQTRLTTTTTTLFALS